MKLITATILLFAQLLLLSCAETQNFNVVDKSATFTNIEISKKFRENWRVQLESNSEAITGHDFNAAPQNRFPENAYSLFRPQNAIKYQGLSYDSPALSYDYSVKRSALSLGYNFIHNKRFSLTLSGGVSMYDYSVEATMPGTVDVYRHYYEYSSKTAMSVDGLKVGDRPEGSVTDKRFVFDYSAVGGYISIEPRYDFNSHYAISARMTGSASKKYSNFLLTVAEASVRFIYKPINHVELYTGYEVWHIANNLNSSVEKHNESEKSLGHSELSIDTRGFLGGVGLRF